MKRALAFLLLASVALCAVGAMVYGAVCVKKTAGAAVELEPSTSPAFSDRDVRAAVRAAKREFVLHYHGKLLAVRFDDAGSRRNEDWGERTFGKKTLRILIDFRTPEKYMGDGFEPDHLYEGWSLTFVKNALGGWMKKSAGYG